MSFTDEAINAFLGLEDSDFTKEKRDKLKDYLKNARETIGKFIEAAKDVEQENLPDQYKNLIKELNLFGTEEDGLLHFVQDKYIINLAFGIELKNFYMFLVSHIRTLQESSLTKADYFKQRHNHLDTYLILIRKIEQLLINVK